MTVSDRWKQTVAIFLLCAATTIASPAQTYTDLHNFDGTDGRSPDFPGVFAQGQDGSLYGTTALGGASDMGVVFKITLTGTLTVLHSFDGTDGEQPHGGLTLGLDGNFYGATGSGTIFKTTPSGDLTVLYTFGTDPGGLEASPILGGDGNFYGTTVNGTGYAYKITPSGTLTLVAPLFENGPRAFPYAPLFYATDGNFYGTTYAAGSGDCFQEGCGTVFRMTPSGTVTILYNFDGEHGQNPYASVLQGSDNDLYGTTVAGGSSDEGTVFQLSRKEFRVLKNLDGRDGDAPVVGVIQATDGNLYGVTEVGGRLNDGVFFRITSAGYSALHDFDKANGLGPQSQLIQHTNGRIYGMTEGGGASDCGVVYSFDLGLPPFVRLMSIVGKVGKEGGILGQGFTGTTSVSINGIPATFTVVSDTYLTATVPPGATTGFVTVVTPSGTLTSNQRLQVRP